MEVKTWVEKILIPTYPTGQPEKNPMFLEKRVYQGSSGVVYPHPVIEKIADEKTDREYTAVFLENEFLKIMILPELGGRIQRAYDKIKKRDFIYYNQVIKPALVGLTGPWISGGIEFNWPQHHRPGTFSPVDFTIEENADGSKTVWLNEVERMFRTKGMAGITVYPGKAYVEIKGKLYNRTPFPQTFLWWANPAVKVNNYYQSIFPPDVYAVFDHGKRDVSSFPIAKGIYYKIDYAPGTDISRYKNIPVPTSYMAILSKYDFIGGYEHDTQGGLLHVANHHISPGKKQWTWGNSDFGKAWDRNLTDEDGPYIELMTGVFTDNQPDFSWLQPYEEKTFEQYFMPYREVGVVKNATKEAVIGVEYTGNQAEIKLHVTGIYPKVSIVLKKGEQVVFKEEINCTPENPYLKTVVLETVIIPEEMLLLVTNSQNNQVLVSYRQEPQTEQELPAAAQAAKRPEEVENNEQLYLTGLHIEQYRHATYVAKDYYEEGLRRDKNDARCNNALGLWYLRRGKPALAEQYLRTAVKTLTSRNPNPYDGEPYYNLGWALKMQGKYDVAYDVFYKCVWNDAWQHAGYLNLARIALMRGNYREAMELIEKSLVKNYHSHTARHAKVIILRKLGAKDQAYAFIEDSLKIDRFNFGCLFEKYLLLSDEGKMGMAAETAQQLLEISRNWVHNFIEYAFDYAHAGLYKEASDLLQLHLSAIKKMPDLLSSDQDKTGNLLSSPHCDITAKNAEFLPLRDGGTEPFSPMVYYYLGWFAFRSGNKEAALQQYLYAVSLSPDFCFPNRIEDVPVLQNAIELNPADAKAYYYLGNFWYDKRQYQEAIACWEKSVGIEDHFATVHRNLSLAYYNKKQDAGKALRSMEKAFALDDSDARILMELDQLHKKLNTPPAERLVTLQKYHSLVLSRDDLYLEWVTLYNQIGQYAEAKQLLAVYRFHPWEGGEGKVIGQHLICHIELAKEAILNGRYQDALLLLEKAESYPLNLGEGKLYGVQENDIHYLKGLVYELMGQSAEAKNYFIKATKGISEPVQAIFYNDAQPDKIFYQGLAWLKLGEPDKAEMIFARLKDFGKQHLDDTIQIDYFAVSLPDLLVFDADLSLKNHIHCLYLAGLGYLGEGNMENAGAYFNQVLKLDINHQGAATHLQMIPFLKSGVVMK